MVVVYPGPNTVDTDTDGPERSDLTREQDPGSSVRGVDGKKRHEARRRETADRVKRAVVTSLAQKLRERPETYDRLIEAGLVDAATISRSPEDLDVAAIVRQFRIGISEMARSQPSVLSRLDVRPLEVVCCDEEELEASRRMLQVPLTVVFSDLEGFTSFTSAHGDLEAGAMLTDHYDAVDAIVRSRGGRVMKTIGDGHLMSFEEPAAAVMAAVDLVGAAPEPLRLRAGAHKGSVVQTDNDLLGHVVNVAARVTQLAAGGVALVTTDVHDAAGRLPRIAFEPARTERVAGLDDPVEVCEVHAA